MYSRSEAILLQRQKSVRLFGPIRGPTRGMEEDHMRKVFIEVCCKTITKNENCSHMRKVFFEEYFKKRKMKDAEVQNLLYCIAKAKHPH